MHSQNYSKPGWSGDLALNVRGSSPQRPLIPLLISLPSWHTYVRRTFLGTAKYILKSLHSKLNYLYFKDKLMHPLKVCNPLFGTILRCTKSPL